MYKTSVVLLLLSISFVIGLPKANKGLPAPPKPNNEQCAIVADKERIDCYPRDQTNQDMCESRGCCWAEPKGDDNAPEHAIPYCFYQPQAPSYTFTSVESNSNGVVAYLQRLYGSPYYTQDVLNLKLEVTYETQSRIRIKLTDADAGRWESPYPKIDDASPISEGMEYDFSLNQDQPGFIVRRKSDGAVVFDASDLSSFIYTAQFMQLTLKLHSTHIYGLGDHLGPLAVNDFYKIYTLWNHDAPPRLDVNLYGSHPFYLALENSGKAHGVFLKNSNAMDVILTPSPSLTYRTIGGVLDFYVFVGPTPANVVQQYTELIGQPQLPPYWGLGFHLCRWGYNTVKDQQAVMERNINAGIPIDTMWNDLDYMERNNDFTYNKDTYGGLPDFVKLLHEQGRHYVPLIDAGVGAGEQRGTHPPFDRGLELDTFIKSESGDLFVGKVWNSAGSTAFPDYTHPNALTYWTEMFKLLHDQVPIDGAWIDMNEIANFFDGTENGCGDNGLDNPPYVPGVEGGMLRTKTLCMSAKHSWGPHYYIHNLHGIMEAEATYSALAEVRGGKRPFIISRATSPGISRYSGHWGGDDFSTWEAMKWSIPHILQFSILGVPLMGADICGFIDNSNAELCNRWMQLGAFYPFSRNHNTQTAIEQDPVAMGTQVVVSSKNALRIRYSLLPYLYTLFWRAHVNGTTVARPLFFEFSDDIATYEIDTQFLWGSALLITPVLEETSDYVRGYLPEGVWYDYYSHQKVVSHGQWNDFNVTKTTIPLSIRGGFILPSQNPELTTTESRKNKITLIAAADENGEAWGELYWDDGDTIDTYENGKYSLLTFVMKTGELVVTLSHKGEEVPPNLETVQVWGVENKVTKATVNGNDVSVLQDDNQLTIKAGDVSWDNKITINWQ